MKETSGIIEIEAGYIDWETMSDSYFNEDGDEITGETYVRINNIFVNSEFRGQGFARKLIESAIELIRKQYRGMEIKIVPEPKEKSVDLSRLAEFYESMGLTVVAV